MNESERRRACIPLLKAGIALIGFLLVMSVSVARCLFNERGIMNIVTTTPYLLKEQQYYNQIIDSSAKDAGLSQKETDRLMLNVRQTYRLVGKTGSNIFTGKFQMLDADELYNMSVGNLEHEIPLDRASRLETSHAGKRYRKNVYSIIGRYNSRSSLRKSLKAYWLLKNNINFANSLLIFLTTVLILLLCEYEDSSRLLFTIGVIAICIAIAVLFIAITMTLSSTVFVEQNMSGESAALIASLAKLLRGYLWFNIFLMCVVGFTSVLISARDDTLAMLARR